MARRFEVLGPLAVGADVAAPSVNINIGRATGAARAGKLTVYGDAQGSSAGSTPHTQVVRTVKNVQLESLSSGVAKKLAAVNIPNLTMFGGMLRYFIEATDGVDTIAITGQVHVSAVRKGGVMTHSIAAFTEAIAKTDAADSLSTSFSVAVFFGNVFDIKVTPTLAGMTPTTFRITFDLESFFNNTIAVYS